MDPALQLLLDKAAIRDLAYTYSRAIDRRDWKLLESCFAPEGDFILAGVVYAKNRDEYIYTVQGIARYERTMHFNGNHLSEVKGDTATAETYTVATHIYKQDGVEKAYVMGIRYVDSLAKRNGTWAFTRRTVFVDWEQGVGTPNPRRAKPTFPSS
jgi:hypothetical protein